MSVVPEAERRLTIPRFLKFRSYQAPYIDAMRAGCKRAIIVWHRRAGKDLTVLNWTIEAMTKRPGTYYYFFPTYAQGKKIIWDGQDKGGRPFLSNFPPELIDGKWEDELRIRLRLPGGAHSSLQVVGTDKMDSIVGTNPVGCVYSEYSLMNPKAWDLMRPVLAENDGWATFVYTPRGKNHGHKLWKITEGQDRWFRSLKTVDDTRRDAEGEDGSVVTTPEHIEAEIADGMDAALVQQEFYCSFEGALQGSYYGDLIVRAREEGRIRPGLLNRNFGVDTAWDLGVDDATAIGFTQTAVSPRGPLVRFVDYHEDSGFGLDHYKTVLDQRGYRYGTHYGPHDIKVTEWSTGNTRLQHAARLGLHFQVVPKISLADGIQAARRLLAIAEYDEERCEKLIASLMAYRREWDDKMMTWRSTPVHDWASHGADMKRYRAIAYYDLGGPKKDAYDGGWSVMDAGRPAEQYDDWDLYRDA